MSFLVMPGGRLRERAILSMSSAFVMRLGPTIRGGGQLRSEQHRRQPFSRSLQRSLPHVGLSTEVRRRLDALIETAGGHPR